MRILKTTLGAIVIVGAAAAGLHLSDRLLAAPDPQVRAETLSETVPVETIPVETARFTDSVRAVGTARARRAIAVTSEASGRITRIAFTPGGAVAQGDLLLALDDRAEQADLMAAEATLAEAQAAFARQEQLNRSGSASDAAFQTARAALLRAEAERDSAQLALEDRRVTAPFDGVTGLTDLVEGQLLDSATPITTLDDLSAIEVDFAVPETLLPRLAQGQAVQLRSAAWPGRVFPAEIARIDTRVDPATRSIALRAQMDNGDRALAGGMFLQVELVLDERRAPAVPETALTVDGDRHLVLVARDGQAQHAEIEVGQQIDGLVEVVAGLEPGTPIIVSNLHRVSPGTAIHATPRTQTASSGAGG
ncbi:efflux RND transporter periplasmic adaptor subunit [Paracoccus beibuensis]|uniref:efflux RND transporter periplasmic adaptor subunit n=1 Tax=Paracoccus beibuensis TaxID=547602 RepID=UPI00223F3EE9|nr:efflux RND transporter periplasmic adaptor subunit [Paracoccus beibuensis]